MYPRIRDLREDHDLTQTKLALLYNTSEDYILGLTNEKKATVLVTKHISQKNNGLHKIIPGMGTAGCQCKRYQEYHNHTANHGNTALQADKQYTNRTGRRADPPISRMNTRKRQNVS